MAESLATLDEGDQLISDIDSLSSDEIAKRLAEEPQTDTQEEFENESEATEEESVDEEVAEESEAEESEELEEESAEKPAQSKDDNRLQQENQRLMDLVQMMVKQRETPKEPEKTLSNEQKIEAFATDPDGYISNLIKPYKEELKKLEQRSVVESARLYNKDYARLEPMVDKLKEAYPSLDNLDLRKREEAYFLIAKGMEAQSRENEAKKAESSQKERRLKAKKEAASMPSAKKKVSEAKKDKPVEKMSLDELEKFIKSRTV